MNYFMPKDMTTLMKWINHMKDTNYQRLLKKKCVTYRDIKPFKKFIP